MTDIVLSNLLSPAVLFFALGLVAALFKSDLRFPSGLGEALSIYLLLAIGLKGGLALSHYTLDQLSAVLLATLSLGIIIPIATYLICAAFKVDRHNAIGLAATYGSVSIVTYGAALNYLHHEHVYYEPYMNAMVVLLESPAILVSLFMLRWMEHKQNNTATYQTPMGITASSMRPFWPDPAVIKESLLGKSVLLMMGGLAIGWLGGERFYPVIEPLFIHLYDSVLILFMLNMGLLAGERLPELRAFGYKLPLFGIIFPLLYGPVGVVLGKWAGLSTGGMMLMGVLAASASYIAAPAALRSSVPEANPSVYLGLALGITFPLNLIIGLPLYYYLAVMLS
ncbi:protein of unknown function DUF897 [Caldalkalibacillus thermarum TA2.A1]|uniref:Sodium-dependent bicarbonate transport family permease n=1 Tax=Caldalkalibacillus thermarum (strain TA2.A1) TaxID=986075 RepID=F5L333_CALTT|nr:sodium-dependent bicarbonate transport family permease [Caldalkalibacillus thermarum]EGL84251.1 protein of unknown function DUF897 [Caldalkalibacillus thermarum TA2.A1]QZT34627.1 sodium-dependent bicarbonate transport family permease [Caldalkalibacillus thermarum TA2.A1]